MKKFRQLSEQLDVSSEHGPNAGRFSTGPAKKPSKTEIQATPRQEVAMESVEQVDEVVTADLKQDLSSLDSSSFKKKHGKSKIEAHKYVSEARMTAAMKLQKAFQREQEKTASERKAGEELLKKPEPVKEGNGYDDNRRGFGKPPREDDEYHVPDPTAKKLKKEEVVTEEKPPFDGPYKKSPKVVKDKSGAEHGPMSRARDLARDAMKKVSSGLPKKKLNESRKAEIVKQASKDAKKKSKEKDVADDKFQPEPTLDSQVIKTD
jgi:hypothetical protein